MSDPNFVEIPTTKIERLAPLWQQLQSHHVSVSSNPSVPPAGRDPEESWQIRKQQYLSWLEDSRAKIILVTKSDQAVGYLMLRFDKSGPTWDWGEHGILETLIVSSDARGSGLGKLMLEYAIEYFRGYSVSRIEITAITGNSKAIELYQKYGAIEHKKILQIPLA